ncbi:hypothetical protein TWF694_005355 [Orbilia ellipsospora]|uniref:Uncharacterized protein n=1 Tax=Orbilia ellipsospora TaxID=2528407 RepID=A0AAV9WSU3_9PEZI
MSIQNTHPPEYTEKPAPNLPFYEICLQESLPGPSAAELEASNLKFQTYRRRQYLLRVLHSFSFVTWAVLLVVYIVLAGRRDRHHQPHDKAPEVMTPKEELKLEALHFVAGTGLVAALLCGFSSLSSVISIVKTEEKRHLQTESGQMIWKALPWWLESKGLDVWLVCTAILQFIIGGILVVKLE